MQADYTPRLHCLTGLLLSALCSLPCCLPARAVTAEIPVAESPSASSVPDTATVATEDPAGSLYVDQLIDPEMAAELFGAELLEEEFEPEGRRYFSVEYQHYRENDADDYSENGLLLNWRRETLNFGELSLESAVRKGGEESFNDNSVGGRFVLRQRDFALDTDHSMDNTAGVLRNTMDTLISNSYRLYLPSALLGGAQSHVSSDNTDFYVSAGRYGRLDPTQIQGFETDDGKQVSLGYSRSFLDDWRAAAYLVHVDGAEEVRDHQSMATALQYVTPDRKQRYQGHLLADSKGNNGVWLDADMQVDRSRYRYGVFRLEPELLWTDTSPTDDQQGGYIRYDIKALRYDLTSGADLIQTDIDNRQDRAGNNLFNAFVNGAWRMTSRTSVGGTLTARGNNPRDDLGGDENRGYFLSGYTAHGFSIGTSRLQLSTARLEEGSDTGHALGIIWDQDWNLRRDLSLSTTLSHERETGLEDEQDISTAALLVRHDISPDLHWNGDVSYSLVDRDQGGRQKNTFASLLLAWNFLPDWDASLRMTYNRLDDVAGGTFSAASDNEKTLLLSVRYSRSRGRPYVLMGQQGDAGGYGEIGGLVFYDENGDGERQAGERGAKGVFVYLDSGYEAVTDSSGRYTFVPVPSGLHEVSVALEDLPLPWGLDDEAPRSVEVGVRKTGEVNFALQRLDR
jgi:hypothetical protein